MQNSRPSVWMYGWIGRRERIRTSDPFVPNEVRYQAAPHADVLNQADYFTTTEITKATLCMHRMQITRTS